MNEPLYSPPLWLFRVHTGSIFKVKNSRIFKDFSKDSPTVFKDHYKFMKNTSLHIKFYSLNKFHVLHRPEKNIKRAFLKSPWKLNLPWKVLEVSDYRFLSVWRPQATFMQTVKTLIRLGRCPVWSAFTVFVCLLGLWFNISFNSYGHDGQITYSHFSWASLDKAVNQYSVHILSL